jgi:hypothetical protein
MKPDSEKLEQTVLALLHLNLVDDNLERNERASTSVGCNGSAIRKELYLRPEDEEQVCSAVKGGSSTVREVLPRVVRSEIAKAK